MTEQFNFFSTLQGSSQHTAARFTARLRRLLLPQSLQHPRDVNLPGACLFAILLLPLAWLGLHAAPQLVDFCAGKFMEADFTSAVLRQYQSYGHQFLGRTLNLLPLALVTESALDYFYVYSSFIMGGLACFIVFARWMIQQLLPTSPRPLRLLASISLALALLANAPTVRELVFSLPGLFTYALPGLGLGLVFLTLYRALAASRDFMWPERLLLLLVTPFCALSNEWTGLALMALLLCAFITRLRLVPEAPAPILHASLLGFSIMGAILLLLGPQQPIFTFDHLGMGVLWSLVYTPEFFVLRLPLPGVIGWFLLLSLSYRPELQGQSLSDRHRQLLSFTLVSLGVVSLIAFAFGYLPSQSRLPARAQNELFILVLVALSLALCLIIPVVRYRLNALGGRYPWLRKPLPLLTIALVLGALSPGVLGGFWQAPEAPAFRQEARARLNLMVNPAEQTVFLPRLSVQPGLLFDHDIDEDPASPRNACVASFFKLDKIQPQPNVP